MKDMTKAEKEVERQDIPENVYHAEKLLVFLLCQNEKKIYEAIKKYLDSTNFRVNLYRKYAEKLYEYYEQMISRCKIDIFISGEVEENVKESILKNIFSFSSCSIYSNA